jgi:hypothetical protein
MALGDHSFVLAKELGPKKIRVNAINPGGVETEGTHSMGFIGSEFEKQLVARTPLGRLGQPNDIAPVAVFLASAASGWMTGIEFHHVEMAKVLRASRTSPVSGCPTRIVPIATTKSCRPSRRTWRSVCGELFAVENEVLLYDVTSTNFDGKCGATSTTRRWFASGAIPPLFVAKLLHRDVKEYAVSKATAFAGAGRLALLCWLTDRGAFRPSLQRKSWMRLRRLPYSQ